MLGYTPEEFPGRAVLEAVGDGQELDPEHVFAFAALRPADRRPDGLWLTGRPRRSGEDEDDVAELLGACARLEADGLRFELTHLRRGESILRVFPDADDRVTDSDAFFSDRHPVLRPQAQVPEAEPTARAAEAWTRKTIEILAGHPVNERRLQQDLPALNVITLKWWGRPRAAPTFPSGTGCMEAPRRLEVSARARGCRRPRAALHRGDGRLARPTFVPASSSPGSGSTRATRSSSRTSRQPTWPGTQRTRRSRSR